MRFLEQKMKNKKKEYIKYTNIVFQMGVIIGGGTYLGHYLDSLYENNNKLWTIIFSLLSIAIALYQIIKSLNK